MKMGMMEKEMMKMVMMEKQKQPSDVPKGDNTTPQCALIDVPKFPKGDNTTPQCALIDVPKFPKGDNTTPQCSLIDVPKFPKGDNTTPQCSLRNTAGDKYCALMSPCPIIIHQIFNKSLFKFQFKLAH